MMRAMLTKYTPRVSRRRSRTSSRCPTMCARRSSTASSSRRPPLAGARARPALLGTLRRRSVRRRRRPRRARRVVDPDRGRHSVCAPRDRSTGTSSAIGGSGSLSLGDSGRLRPSPTGCARSSLRRGLRTIGFASVASTRSMPCTSTGFSTRRRTRWRRFASTGRRVIGTRSAPTTNSRRRASRHSLPSSSRRGGSFRRSPWRSRNETVDHVREPAFDVMGH